MKIELYVKNKNVNNQKTEKRKDLKKEKTTKNKNKKIFLLKLSVIELYNLFHVNHKGNFMKKFLQKFLFLLAIYCFFNTSFANEPLYEPSINNNDPCTVFLCMAGKVKGENPSECSGPTKKFFSIFSKKHGKFNGGRTSNARSSFLGKCPNAEPDMIKKIISKFGKLRH